MMPYCQINLCLASLKQKNAPISRGILLATFGYYSVKADIFSSMVHPTGFEPTTFCSASKRSIQLSYGCISMREHHLEIQLKIFQMLT